MFGKAGGVESEQQRLIPTHAQVPTSMSRRISPVSPPSRRGHQDHSSGLAAGAAPPVLGACEGLGVLGGGAGTSESGGSGLPVRWASQHCHGMTGRGNEPVVEAHTVATKRATTKGSI